MVVGALLRPERVPAPGLLSSTEPPLLVKRPPAIPSMLPWIVNAVPPRSTPLDSSPPKTRSLMVMDPLAGMVAMSNVVGGMNTLSVVAGGPDGSQLVGSVQSPLVIPVHVTVPAGRATSTHVGSSSMNGAFAKMAHDVGAVGLKGRSAGVSAASPLAFETTLIGESCVSH